MVGVKKELRKGTRVDERAWGLHECVRPCGFEKVPQFATGP